MTGARLLSLKKKRHPVGEPADSSPEEFGSAPKLSAYNGATGACGSLNRLL